MFKLEKSSAFAHLLMTAAIVAFTIVPSWSSAAPPSIDPTFNLRTAPHKIATVQHPVASWIWAGTTSDNQTIYLRKSFTLISAPKSVMLYITVDDSYVAYLNGQLLQSTTPSPQLANPWQQVQQYNITSLLKPGQNVFAVIGHNNAFAAGVCACLIADAKPIFISDPTWMVSTNSSAPEGWQDGGFDDSGWAHATVIAKLGEGIWSGVGGISGWPYPVESSADYMAHINLPFVAVEEIHSGDGHIAGVSARRGAIDGPISVTLAPVGSSKSPDLVLDFGKEIAGRVVLDAITPGTVIVSHGESVGEALNSPWHGPATIAMTPSVVNATDYSAFRYVRMQFPTTPGSATGPVEFKIHVDHKYYPVTYKGNFDCSDPLLTKIWYTGAYTSHLCMQEDIWDAPKRDRAKWVGDLHVSGEVINNVFADKFLMEQTLNRLRDDAGNGDVNGIPGYSCAWICCLADFHRHIGDYVFLNSQHDRLVALLEHMRGDLDSRGIVTKSQGSWMYTDWSPGFDGDTPLSEATTHLFLTKAVTESVFLLDEMGDRSSADKYASWAAELNANAHQYLADSATNTYSNRLQENAMAIYSGVATPDQQASIYKLVLDPSSPSWNRDGALLGAKPVMSPYYGNYIISAMSMAGHTDGALQIIRLFWGNMIKDGATTFYEAYDPTWPKTDFHRFLQADDGQGYFVSLCHGWSSGPTSFLTERVLGIRPTGGGFKTVDIVPDLAGLSWAQGTVPTPQGVLKVKAVSVSSGLSVSLTVPKGVKARVGVPGTSVKINGLVTLTTVGDDGKSYVLIDHPGNYTVTGS